MYSFNKIIRENRYFLLPYLIVVLAAVPVLFIYDKQELHLAINKFNSAFGDQFFKYATTLGDGVTPFIIGAILCVFSFRKGFLLAAGGTIAGITAQFFKRVVFPDVARPFAHFKDLADFHIVDGVNMYTSYSFPSGHSSTVFALVFCLAFLSRNQIAKLTLLLIGFVVAFSRVYLSQHFLNDIVAGSGIGVIMAIISINWIMKANWNWLDSSLLQLLKYNRKNE